MENENDSTLQIYELGYHIIPAVSEEEAPKEAAAIKNFIEQNGGKVISEEAPKHMELAYAMYRTESGKKEKFDTSHFGGIKFTSQLRQPRIQQLILLSTFLQTPF